MDKLAAAVVFTSQGIPFIEAGQEFLRTRGWDHNSFDKPDSVNMIRWRDKAVNADVYQYYAGLIKLRLAHPLFRIGSGDAVRKAIRFLDDGLGVELPGGCVGFQIVDVEEKDSWSRALVLLNSQARARELKIPEGRWKVFADHLRADVRPVNSAVSEVSGGLVTVAGRSALILGEERA